MKAEKCTPSVLLGLGGGMGEWGEGGGVGAKNALAASKLLLLYGRGIPPSRVQKLQR